MSILESIKSLIFKDKEVQRLKVAIHVISLYGDVIGQYAGHTKAPISKLPTSKDAIIGAAKLLITASKEPLFKARLSKFLTKEQVEHVASKSFADNIAAGLVLLDTFVPDDEAEKEIARTNKIQEMISAFDASQK